MKTVGENNKAIRDASGNVVHEDRIVSFFYELMRDHLPAGEVEKIVRRVLDEDYDVHYCNGWLADYAKFIVKRLRTGELNLIVRNCFIQAKPDDPANPFLECPVVLDGYAIVPRGEYKNDGAFLRSIPIAEKP